VLREFASRPYALDLVNNPPRHVVREIEAALGFWQLPPPPATVLEMGSGTGRLTKPLLERGYRVLACDPDARAQQGLRDLQAGDRLEVFGSVEAVPTGEPIAAVVGVDILHHARPEDILALARTRLPPGGVAGFDEPDGAHAGWWAFVTLTGRLTNELGLARATKTKLMRRLDEAGFAEPRAMRWAPSWRGKLGPRWFYAARKGGV